MTDENIVLSFFSVGNLRDNYACQLLSTRCRVKNKRVTNEYIRKYIVITENKERTISWLRVQVDVTS